MGDWTDLQARAERLIVDVEGAFDEAEPPSRPELLEPQERELDIDEAETFASAIDGLRWDGLERPWLKKWRFDFCYLAPAAWAYYIPSLLRDALLRLSDRRAPRAHRDGLDYDVVAVLDELTPRVFEVWESGRDERLEARIAALTPEQYDVACRFLALVHDVSSDYGATRAARWSWTQHAAPALDALRAHAAREDVRLYEHTWPDPHDPRIRALATQVLEAFTDRPYPGDDELLGEGGGEEPFQAALQFRGRDWRRLHPDVLHPQPLYFLSDAGLCYFLPAYLLGVLHGHDPYASISAVLAGAGEPDDDFWLERLSGLGPRECGAVAVCLRQFLDAGGAELFPEEEESIEASLERYWLPRSRF